MNRSLPLLLLLVAVTHAAQWPESAWPTYEDLIAAPAPGEDQIKFEREYITEAEGYWASNKDPQQDHYAGQYPFPIVHAEPWPGKEEFLEKLSIATRGARMHIYRGFSISRITGQPLGSCEFESSFGIRWTQDFGPHYVAQYNVIPSREFYRYIHAITK